ncbi:hypothetical protein [Sphingomonas sp.]|uniref:hypothetical protein n=1 Tax=Sphingomonas sp. TaxID=28214 RepID=UPI000DB30240|nr:hypothetical protein [Sphingomonas sp.]PZU10255.1 MAG: hypothetical protein DI605_06645 [Sphingomonas sp.]
MSAIRFIGAVALVVGLGLIAARAVSLRDDALRDQAQAAAQARAAPFRLERGSGLAVPDPKMAAATLAALIADRGSAAGVRFSVRPLDAATVPGVAAVDLDARGEEGALRTLARAIEGERPLIRMIRWSIRPAAGGLLRLDARAVAPLAARG